MAAMAAAQLLDELMGRNRNTNPNEKQQKIHWEDPQYCKYYMVKFCPHDLFVNTRADLGVCQRIHDDEVKKLFEKAELCYKKSYYQDEFLRFCQNMISDVERKIQKGRQRLELMNDKSQHAAMVSSQIKLLTDRIAKLETEAEEAGIRGDVDQAQGLMDICDKLKEDRENLQNQADNNIHPTATAELAAAQEKQMEVCTVCGAFLIVGDAQQRIDDHLMGKQHVGYFRLKEAFDEISKERERQRSDKERRRREEHSKEKDGNRRDRGDRDRDRDRDRERRGGRNDRDKDREREREPRDRDWDRGLDKERTDRDKERSDRDKERSDRDSRSKSHRSNRDERRSSKSHDERGRDHERKHRNDKDKNDRGGRERSWDRGDRGENRRKRSRSRGH